MEYWQEKLAKNVERDRIRQNELIRAGWRILVLWECEIKRPEKVAFNIRRFLDNPASNR